MGLYPHILSAAVMSR